MVSDCTHGPPSHGAPAGMESLVVHPPSHPLGGSNGVSGAEASAFSQEAALAVSVPGSVHAPAGTPHAHGSQNATAMGSARPSYAMTPAVSGQGGACDSGPIHTRLGGSHPSGFADKHTPSQLPIGPSTDASPASVAPPPVVHTPLLQDRLQHASSWKQGSPAGTQLPG